MQIEGGFLSEHFDIGSFLAQQHAVGQVIDEGQFTIAHDKALQKLAKFALPRDTAWALKAVQAAVSWGATAIEIHQSGQESLFHIMLADGADFPSEDEIVSNLLSGKIGGKEPLDDLCMGLRAVVEQAKLSFILVVDNGKVKPRPIYAGHHYAEISESERLAHRFHPKRGLSLTINHTPHVEFSQRDLLSVFGRCEGFIRVVQELDAYAFMSPIPIILDGRRIDSLMESPSMGLGPQRRLLALLALEPAVRRFFVHSPKEFSLPHDFEVKQPSLLATRRRAARSYGGAREASAAMMITIGTGLTDLSGVGRLRSSPNRILWIARGVVTHQEVLRVSPKLLCLTVFANAEGLETDLTGFTLSAGKAYWERRNEVLRAVAFTLGGVDLKEDRLFAQDKDEESGRDAAVEESSRVQNRIRTLLKGAGAGLGMTLVNPYIGVPLIVGTLVMTYARTSADPDQLLQNYRQQIMTDLVGDLQAFKKVLQGMEEQRKPILLEDGEEGSDHEEILARLNALKVRRQGDGRSTIEFDSEEPPRDIA